VLKDLHSIQYKNPVVESSDITDFRIPYSLQEELNNTLGSAGYHFNSYTSHVITAKATSSKPENIAVIPNQYMVYACDLYDFAIALYSYFEIFEALRAKASQLLGDAATITANINADPDLNNHFTDTNDIDLFSKFLDKVDRSYRFDSKNLINDQGVPRGARDCFGSVILKIINIPDTSSGIFGGFVYDLCGNKHAYDDLLEYKQKINVHLSLTSTPKNRVTLPKPFVLLAGISGTGKSRFVRKQAEEWQGIDNFELVAVRPDWHEPSDLLGYILRLKDKPEFISTPVIKFLVSALLEAYKQGIEFKKDDNNKLIADCSGKQTAPFWLCLDEMNLAPVEQYFADYLSVLETREWNDEVYSSAPLIKPEFLKDVINENESEVRKAMGLNDESEDSNHDALWRFIKENGLPIPFNLIVAGTVNMDETTHGFSRKVIDRALSWDFGEFFPNDFDTFFNQTSKPKTLSYPTLSHPTVEKVGKYANATIDFLKAINKVLKGTLFELAYRALNECLLAVACEQPQDEKHLQAVWDDFLMMKVLPRIEGDEDKLKSLKTDDDNLFIALENLLKTQFDQIWEGTNRPDLLREHIDEPKKILIKCRSKTKIQRMSKLLENGFTSFWP